MNNDAVFMEFDDPGDPRHPWDGAPRGKKGQAKKKSAGKQVEKEKKAVIPRLPELQKPLTGDEIRRGVSDRNRAAAKYRVKGYSYDEIAELCEFDTAADAKRAVESVVAATLAPEEIDMQRAIILSRQEDLFRQSNAMAHADFLVDDEGTKIPNTEKLRWHQQASSDLMAIATLTGAKAPTKVEISPGEAEMERIVNAIVLRAGHEDIVDAEVIDLDLIPAIESADGEEDDEWDDESES